MGLYKLMYRYPRFAAVNRDNPNVVAEIGQSVEPFSDEYGAHLQLKILLIQAGVFAGLLILFLLMCKNEPDKEPQDVNPEEDQFAQSEEVKAEEARIEKIIKSREQMNTNEINPDIAHEILVVHKLVKRYYTEPPVDTENQVREDRPSLHNREDEQQEGVES